MSEKPSEQTERTGTHTNGTLDRVREIGYRAWFKSDLWLRFLGPTRVDLVHAHFLSFRDQLVSPLHETAREASRPHLTIVMYKPTSAHLFSRVVLCLSSRNVNIERSKRKLVISDLKKEDLESWKISVKFEFLILKLFLFFIEMNFCIRSVNFVSQLKKKKKNLKKN